ncbi:MAG TPA: metal-dependent hydrolase [Burkholderiales bacterium]|nr:metal-dependent hydrolase [Burkholderiales bacterium]
MFIGHFAVAFAARRAAPAVSLGTLFVACELVDLLWPVMLLIGWETVRIAPGITAFTPLDFTHYPWTHSLAMCAVWALALAAVYRAFRPDTRGAIIIALVVLSHWFLDALSHRPDLPLAPGGEVRVGAGLWNSIPATLAVELAMFAIAIALYLRSSRARDRAGVIGLWALLAVLLASYFGAAFGPPPPNVDAIAWAGLAGGALMSGWGYWIERHREMRR